jgi:hypothetical protein
MSDNCDIVILAIKPQFSIPIASRPATRHHCEKEIGQKRVFPHRRVALNQTALWNAKYDDSAEQIDVLRL